MPVFRNKNDVYERCNAEGNLRPLETINIDKIKANMGNAEEDLESAKDILSKQRWNSAYKLYYDVVHELVEAYLAFDMVKSLNHQCLFSYLCVKHPELELNWDFFEKMRTKRNGINYYSTPVTQQDWKEIEFQMNLYIQSLKKAVEDKIKEFTA